MHHDVSENNSRIYKTRLEIIYNITKFPKTVHIKESLAIPPGDLLTGVR